jgi:hypothetical protein
MIHGSSEQQVLLSIASHIIELPEKIKPDVNRHRPHNTDKSDASIGTKLAESYFNFRWRYEKDDLKCVRQPVAVIYKTINLSHNDATFGKSQSFDA